MRNIFKLHNNILNGYQQYIESFINISDQRIKHYVEQELLSRKILPEPLIQFNPSFVVGGSIADLINQGVLHKNLDHCFKGWELFQHQREAIEIGARNEGFVVTSGTGSGKSLTYIATIFNRIFNEGIGQPGVKAVIVYPMNALINSQFDALEDFAKALTNYMMLELILTRAKELKLMEAVYNNLQFLVFDELHTYRGRQGADVALLIRRIKAQCSNSKIVCIGTSATMASGEGTLQSQREAVANVATKIFGQEIKWENVITESLQGWT